MRPEKLTLELESNTRFKQTILQKFRSNESVGVGELFDLFPHFVSSSNFFFIESFESSVPGD